MNTIGIEYVLASANKNAHIVNRQTGKMEIELNLKNREMSSSLIVGDFLFVGTYVDSLFIFSISGF